MSKERLFKLPRGFDKRFYIIPPEYERTEMTITHLLEYGVEHNPTAEFVPYPPRAGVERFTLKDMYEGVQRLANVLEEIGVKIGTKVGVADHTSVPFLEAGFAVPCMGAVLHPVNIRLTEKDLGFTIDHAEDEVLITFEQFVPFLERAKADGELDTVKHFIISTTDGKPIDTKLEPVTFYEEACKCAHASYEFPEIREETPAIILHTTGTTGVPKGCWYMHRNITLDAVLGRVGATALPFEYSVLNVVPFYHIMAWGAPYEFMLGTGGKFVWAGPPEAEWQLMLIEREKITIWMGVPTLVFMMLTHPSIDKYDLSSLRVVAAGGAATPEGLKKLIQVKMPNVIPYTGAAVGKVGAKHMGDRAAYGLTETWAPFPEFASKFKVLDENMRESSIGGSGEFCGRGVNCTIGYIKDPVRSSDLWKGGYLHTGDAVSIDDDGSYLLVDRVKDVVKSGGEFIMTLPLESVLSTHPMLAQVAVIPADHPKWGERPVAVCRLKKSLTKEEEEKLKTELTELLIQQAAQFPKWYRPDEYVFTMEPLPLTSVEKIDKKVLKEKYRGILIEKGKI